MSIEMSSDLIDDNDNILICKNENNAFGPLCFAIFSIIMVIVYICMLIFHCKK